MSNKTKSKTTRPRTFLENPFDIETVFESLSAATDSGKELLYMDRLIAAIRNNPTADLTEVSYQILSELGAIKLEK